MTGTASATRSSLVAGDGDVSLVQRKERTARAQHDARTYLVYLCTLSSLAREKIARVVYSFVLICFDMYVGPKGVFSYYDSA